jgi:hypothetical protein
MRGWIVCTHHIVNTIEIKIIVLFIYIFQEHGDDAHSPLNLHIETLRTSLKWLDPRFNLFTVCRFLVFGLPLLPLPKNMGKKSILLFSASK